MQNNKLTFDGNAYRIELSSGVVYEGSTTNLIAHFSVDTITICDRATKLHIPIMSSRANILEIDGEVKTFEQAQVAIEDALSSAGGASSADKVSYSGVVQADNVKDAIDAVGANLGEITPKVESLMDRADLVSVQAENVGYSSSVGLNSTNVKNALDELAVKTNIDREVSSNKTLHQAWNYTNSESLISFNAESGEIVNIAFSLTSALAGNLFLRLFNLDTDQYITIDTIPANNASAERAISISESGNYDLRFGSSNSNDNITITSKIVYKSIKYNSLYGKNIAFIGDSAIDVNGVDGWAFVMCKLLGANCRKYALGGYTYLIQKDNGNFNYCFAKQLDTMDNEHTSNNYNPDVIVILGGGNDYSMLGRLGTLADAFPSTPFNADKNWKRLSDSTTIYEGIRYTIQRAKETYPNSLIVVGTILQCGGSARLEMANAIKEVCDKLSVICIDTNSISGISAYSEPFTPSYKDSDAVASEDNKVYNWVEPNGDVVSVENKSENAVKKYGLFTYDGTHKTKSADVKFANLFARQLLTYYN